MTRPVPDLFRVIEAFEFFARQLEAGVSFEDLLDVRRGKSVLSPTDEIAYRSFTVEESAAALGLMDSVTRARKRVTSETAEMVELGVRRGIKDYEALPDSIDPATREQILECQLRGTELQLVSRLLLELRAARLVYREKVEGH